MSVAAKQYQRGMQQARAAARSECTLLQHLAWMAVQCVIKCLLHGADAVASLGLLQLAQTPEQARGHVHEHSNAQGALLTDPHGCCPAVVRLQVHADLQ
jgi:hypothetical protein